MNQNYFLSLDLSRLQGSVALAKGYKLIEEACLPGLTTHTEQLLPAIDKILTSQSLTLREISEILVSSGPGSFTGLRVAFATVKAIALAHGTPVSAFSTAYCRSIGFCRDFPNTPPPTHVVTTIASNRFLIDSNEGSLLSMEALVEELSATASKKDLVLVDESCDQQLKKLSAPLIFSTKLWPSFARFLFFAREGKAAGETYRTKEEVFAASPKYFGTTKFALASPPISTNDKSSHKR